MKRLAILFLMFAPLANADDIRFAPDVSVQAAVTLVADADGVLQIDRSKPILIGSVTGTTPTDPIDPVDPVDPTPPVTDPLAVKVSTLIATAPTDAAGRKTVSELFKMTGQLPLTDPSQIRQATAILFGSLPMSAAWKAWKAAADSFAAGLDIADIKRAWLLISEALLK